MQLHVHSLVIECQVCNPDFPVSCYHLLQVERIEIAIARLSFDLPDPLVGGSAQPSCVRTSEGWMILMTCSDAGLEQAGKGRKLRRDSDSYRSTSFLGMKCERNTSRQFPRPDVLEIKERTWLQSMVIFGQVEEKDPSYDFFISQKSTEEENGGDSGRHFESTPSLPLSRRCFPAIPCYVKCSLRKPNLKKKKSHFEAMCML